MPLAPESNMKQLAVSSMRHFVDSGKLNLAPSYQRDEVWTKAQQRYLIDSLLKGYDIPKFYWRTVTKGKYQWEVVDGQQRTRAIVGYLNNEFELKRDAEPIDGVEIKGLFFKELPADLQENLLQFQITAVVFNEAYTDAIIEDIFLRMQGGTPLNAAEKRRAVQGNMREVVKELATEKVFEYCGFSDLRYAYEDAVSKVLHLRLSKKITDIRPASIEKTYRSHKSITTADKDVKALLAAYKFITKAFSGTTNPMFKKYAMITVPYLVAHLLERYNLSRFPSEFAAAYLEFEAMRQTQAELPEEDQDAEIYSFRDATRNDSAGSIQYRHDLPMKVILAGIPDLAPKDASRDFSQEQRVAVHYMFEGVCQHCKAEIALEDSHIDHVIPHRDGGPTTLADAQLLCASCNLKKADSNPVKSKK